ncbi:energy transducer TonB [Taibaiella chishuiensis]|uniref:Protein TonB n=1 Tax=Taibaiella chishuiensis TaxID=1434707 RepID=A0A2P8DCL6_9BACT|nr:energy transducer TonB [Taibaiella chishuiensis]PSK94960.1 protein TonB [Taibaiella chishuiensis]
METKKILEADYLDLIFDQRNKAYGSYELRKHYGRRTLKALGITMAILAGGITAPFVLSELHAKTPVELKPDERIIPAITLKDIEPPKPPAPPPPPPSPEKPPAPPPVAPSLKNLPPVIVPPERVKPEDVPPTADELKDKLSAAADNPGTPGGIAAALSTDKPEVNGGGEPSPAEHKEGLGRKGNNGDFVFVEQMPEFPGGQKALMDFLRKNLRYPKTAIEQEIEGNVHVSFVVNAQGVIENIKLLRGIGGGCNEEAVRVVSAMPKWKPGKQNGQFVRVSYIMPIAFRLAR